MGTRLSKLGPRADNRGSIGQRRDGGHTRDRRAGLPRLAALVIVASMTVAGFPGASLAAENHEAPMLVGLASNAGEITSDLDAFEAATGRSVGMYQLFWSLDRAWPTDWAPGLLEQIHQRGTTPYIEITASDFESFDAGGYEEALDGLIANIEEWMANGTGRNVVVAPFPEANLGQFSWGNNPEGYKRGFLRVRQAFLDAGIGLDRARFVFAMNGPGSDLYEYDAYYPGDDVVDVIGFSKLNRGDPWHTYETNFGIHIEEMKDLIGTSKPILITQTASVTEGGDRSAWISDMFDGLGSDDQVIGTVYFNVLKTEGGVERDYRILEGGVLDPAFAAGVESWSGGPATNWLFDGGLDAWVAARAAAPFDDVLESVFIEDIAWLAREGITTGCNPPANDLFCPDDAVTRGQMAAFLVRAFGYQEVGTAEFRDDDETPFELDIEKLAHQGVTTGCNPPLNDRYCPDDRVTRGQMAAFLVRALGLTDTGQLDFIDDDDSVFEDDIEKLAHRGITAGCNPPVNDRFCPGDLVTRGQMAAFLHRALG